MRPENRPIVGKRPRLSRDLALAVFFGWAGACPGQPSPPTCAAADRACFDENYPRMCDDKGASQESCGAWLRSVTEQDPTNVHALFRLAFIAATSDERVALLRRVVALDPSPFNLESLSSALSLNDGDLAESAALSERAYESAMAQQGGPYAWRFARNAVFTYDEAGLPQRAAQLRARFVRDADLDAKVAETVRAQSVEPARLKGILAEVCGEIVVRLVGGSRCLAAIQHVVDAADRAGAPAAQLRLATSASDAMFLVAQTAGDVLTRDDPEWRGRFERTLLRYFGTESADRMRHTVTEITVE